MSYQGEPAKHLLLLWKGRARYFYEISNDKKLILKWITPGGIFGGAALVSGPSTYLVSTEAVTNSIVVEWDGSTIHDLARRFPQLLENAHLIDMDYVSWYVACPCCLSFTEYATEAGIRTLWIGNKFWPKVSGGIKLDVTNEELADSANITLYTTSRLISEWNSSGAIRRRRGKILVLSPETFFVRGETPAGSHLAKE